MPSSVDRKNTPEFPSASCLNSSVRSKSVNAASVRYKAKDLAGARAAVADGLRLGGHSWHLFHVMGEVCEAEGELEDALSWYRRAADAQAGGWARMVRVIRTLRRLGRDEVVVPELRRFTAVHPRVHEAWFSLGRELVKTGEGDPERMAAGQAAVEKALALAPDDYGYGISAAALRSYRQDYGGARKLLTRLVALCSERAEGAAGDVRDEWLARRAAAQKELERLPAAPPQPEAAGDGGPPEDKESQDG